MRFLSSSLASLAVALIFAASCFAHAETIDNFTITYLNFDYPGDTEVYTFSLPANATPGSTYCYSPGSCSFTFDNVAYNAHGDDPTVEGPGTDTETFFTLAYQNAYNPDYSFDNGFGGGTVAFPAPQQYFTGDVTNPTFTPGTYFFTYSDGEAAPDGTIVITAQTPEPSSYILLGTGMLGIIGAARRRNSYVRTWTKS